MASHTLAVPVDSLKSFTCTSPGLHLHDYIAVFISGLVGREGGGGGGGHPYLFRTEVLAAGLNSSAHTSKDASPAAAP